MAVRAAANGRASDKDPVAIDVHHLLRDADQDHQGTLRRNFRMPPVFPRFEFAGWFTSGRTLGVKGGLLHCEGRGEKRSQSKKQIAKFHNCPVSTTMEAGHGLPA